MGYKTEINYILKATSPEEGRYMRDNLVKGRPMKVVKFGMRTYPVGAPIMFADENWKILGMCSIVTSTVHALRNNETDLGTEVLALILTVFTEEEKTNLIAFMKTLTDYDFLGN